MTPRDWHELDRLHRARRTGRDGRSIVRIEKGWVQPSAVSSPGISLPIERELALRTMSAATSHSGGQGVTNAVTAAQHRVCDASPRRHKLRKQIDGSGRTQLKLQLPADTCVCRSNQIPVWMLSPRSGLRLSQGKYTADNSFLVTNTFED